MLYLSSPSRPDIACVAYCAAHSMFCPRHSYELALKRIGRFLKATHSRVLILNPSFNLKKDCYPDADFSGMYRHKKIHDPACVKKGTGYIITMADYPVHWQSKLQWIDMVTSLSDAVGLPKVLTTMHVSIHEDNAGALILTETLPHLCTPWSKHYAIKTIWFCEEIVKKGIKLVKINNFEQLGDIFTKTLSWVTFEYFRSKLLGW